MQANASLFLKRWKKLPRWFNIAWLIEENANRFTVRLFTRNDDTLN